MTAADFKKAYTNTYWVTLEGGRAGCITVLPTEDPLAVAAELGTLKTIETLPYPANPVLRRRALRDANDCHCPEFCYTPQQCKGRTCCPKSYACSE